MNEKSERTTFQSRRESSNMDLTVINNRLLKNFHGWEISENQSCSDHNIIKFKLGDETKHVVQHNHYGLRCMLQEKIYNRFDQNLIELVSMKFQMENTEDVASPDSNLATHTKETGDIESVVEKLQEAITFSCNKSFKIRENAKKTILQKSVPWWTEELTIKRKNMNALARRYQRTKNNEEFREHRKNIYYEGKTTYQATIKRGKLK